MAEINLNVQNTDKINFDRCVVEKSVMSEEAKKDHNKKITKQIVFNTIFYIVVIMICCGTVMPFLWSLLSSFRPKEEITSLVFTFLPKSLTLEHYKNVFDSIPFFTNLFNSLFTTLVGLVTNLFFGSLAAYGFTKLGFKGSKLVFNVMMISMMIPGVITLIPTFLVIARFPLVGGNNILGSGGRGFYNNLAAVILPGAIGVYGIFFMRQFFVSLSDDMAESARIDGASELRIFMQIYLPLVLPGLMTLGIFTFQGGWNNFMWPNIVLSDDKLKLLTQTFTVFKNPRSVQYGPLMALSILMSLPIVLLFIFAQKYFIKGVAIGSTKG